MTTWTRTDHTRLETLLEAGLSYAAAAKQLRRTPRAVQLKGHRRGLFRERHHATLSAAQTAALLGVSPNTMTCLIRRGWLPAINITSQGTRPTWRIHPDHLRVFLADWRYDYTWHPALITDPALRAWATAERATHPRWLTVREAAAARHVSVITMRRWYQRYGLPIARWDHVYINETALDTFRAPGGHQ